MRVFPSIVLLVGCGDVIQSHPDANGHSDAASVACQTLDPPMHGTVMTTNGNNYPSTATYSCGGLVMNGPGTRTCMADGSWSDSAPTCEWSGARTFTNCAQTGNTGPSQGQCDTAYTATTLAGAVTVTAGIQAWTVPATGTYRIVVDGAAGSSIGGWSGARMQGDFALTQGAVLKILVGQIPIGVLAGGGGTFVTQNNNTPLIIAGGGGSGNCTTDCVVAESGGRIELTGGAMTGLARAADGAGGATGNAVSGAGGGLLTDGASGGQAFVNGGLGAVGMAGYFGGFGGGGARNGANGTGGGGGYSGGGANSTGTDTTIRFGGGGASFNSGSNPVGTAAVNTTDGKVSIDLL